LDLKASYSIDGRDMNNNPVTLTESPRAEAGADSTTNTIISQSWTKQKADLEAGYRIIQSTKLTLGYAYDDVHRTAGDAVGGTASVGYWVGHSTENTGSVKLASTLLPNLNGAVTYEHAVRAGNFEFAAPLDSGAFYQAPRTADRVKLRTDYMPTDEITVGFNGKVETNRYHYQEGQTGVTRDSNISAGPDITYTPFPNLSLHGFYTYQQIYYNNFGNGCPSTGTTAGTTGSCPSGYNAAQPANGFGFDAATTDTVHTVGLSTDWKPTPRMKVGLEYEFSYGDVTYNMLDGLYAPVTLASYENLQNLPRVNSSLHTFKLRGEYQLTDNMTLLAGYGFELFKDNDWAYGWSPVVLTNTTVGGGTGYNSVSSLSTGENQPSYRVHFLYTGVRIKF
jgi:opacity protein-like surface antigen